MASRRAPDWTLLFWRRVKADLKGCGIDADVSDRIEMEIFRKFSFVSTAAACGSYYGVTIGDIQQEGIYRDTVSGALHRD